MSNSSVDHPQTGSDDTDFVVVERPTARVSLPAKDPEIHDHDETDEESVDEDGGGNNEDFLADFPDDTEELEVVNQRVKSLESFKLKRFAGHLKRLCLRQNAISALDLGMFEQLTKLEELDLYDNKIKTEGVSNSSTGQDNLSSLCTLDLSFNLLKTIPDVLSRLTSLKTVYFVQNRISKITGLEALGASLTSLELGGNKIRRIEGLDALVNLEELWLGKNKLPMLENLGTLTKLRILSLQSNRITKIENLEKLQNLEELYLSHNGVEKLEGLEHNKQLKTLDLGMNFIRTIENISHLTLLEELWLNGNKIPDLGALEAQLKQITSLQTIYLEGNPCQEREGASYRRKIMLYLPQLRQIDATFAKPL
ncbi:hypothetical protein F5I97DRAFT_1890018 [Phlebopus sp. FC_14]|nr:hypothetical protein F5I97DRAFT_1890018 [Phlebopus sp. FC_14]